MTISVTWGCILDFCSAKCAPRLVQIWDLSGTVIMLSRLCQVQAKGLAGCAAWEGIVAKCLLVARDRFDRVQWLCD